MGKTISHLIYLGFDGRAQNDHVHCAIKKNGDGEWEAYDDYFEISELVGFMVSTPLQGHGCHGTFDGLNPGYVRNQFDYCRKSTGAIIVCGIEGDDGENRNEVFAIYNRGTLNLFCAINPSFANFVAYAEDPVSPSSVVPTCLFDAFDIQRDVQSASLFSIDLDTVNEWVLDFDRCRNFVHDVIDPIIPRILFGPNVGGHVSLDNVKEIIGILAKSSPSIRERALHHLQLLEQENFPGMQNGAYDVYPGTVVTGGRIFRNWRSGDHFDIPNNLTDHQLEAIEILHGNIFSQEVRRQEIQLNGIQQRYLMSLVSLLTNPNTPIDVNDEQQVLQAMDALYARANTSVRDMLFDRLEIKVAKLQGLYEPALHEAVRILADYTNLETQAILHGLLPDIFDEPCKPIIDPPTFSGAAGLGCFQ